MNKQNYKLLVWLVIILGILNLTALGTFLWLRLSTPEIAGCTYSPKQHQHQMHKFDVLMRDELGFDDAQFQKFSAIRNQHFEKIKEIKVELEKVRKEQFALLRQENVNQVMLDSLNNRIGTLHQSWAQQSINFLQETQLICTPSQKTRMLDLMEQGKMNPMKRKGKHLNHEKGASCRMDPESDTE